MKGAQGVIARRAMGGLIFFFFLFHPCFPPRRVGEESDPDICSTKVTITKQEGKKGGKEGNRFSFKILQPHEPPERFEGGSTNFFIAMQVQHS